MSRPTPAQQYTLHKSYTPPLQRGARLIVKVEKPVPTREDLERRIAELQAQLAAKQARDERHAERVAHVDGLAQEYFGDWYVQSSKSQYRRVVYA